MEQAKTTLIGMLCTLLKPTGGTIYCDEKDIFSMDGEYRKLLNYLPQEFGFLSRIYDKRLSSLYRFFERDKTDCC